MKRIVKFAEGKPQIDKLAAFIQGVKNISFERDQELEIFMQSMDDLVREEAPSIAQGALNNGHGDWFEWCIGIIALRLSQSLKEFVLVPLPNVRKYNVFNLYEPRIANVVNDLRDKVEKDHGVNFVTSNPDFAIIRYSQIRQPLPLDASIEDQVKFLNTWHLDFDGTCGFDDIRGFLSVKNSLRPDRRLQIAHEGSLMKAIYVHIQTRLWLSKAVGYKYYAMSGSSVSTADHAAMSTIATHSITTVQSTPKPAVDGLFEGTSFVKIRTSVESIFNSVGDTI